MDFPHFVEFMSRISEREDGQLAKLQEEHPHVFRQLALKVVEVQSAPDPVETFRKDSRNERLNRMGL